MREMDCLAQHSLLIQLSTYSMQKNKKKHCLLDCDDTKTNYRRSFVSSTLTVKHSQFNMTLHTASKIFTQRNINHYFRGLRL